MDVEGIQLDGNTGRSNRRNPYTDEQVDDKSNKTRSNKKREERTKQMDQHQRNFFQGSSFSAVGFCCTEIPVTMLLEGTREYSMAKPGEREILKGHIVCSSTTLRCNRKPLKGHRLANEIIVKASIDTGTMNGIRNVPRLCLEEIKW